MALLFLFVAITAPPTPPSSASPPAVVAVVVRAMLKVAAVDHCRFEWWYPRFERYTFKSTIVPLPEEFLDWLRFSDGITMDDADFPIAWAGREISNDELLLDDTPLDLLLDARDQRDSLSMPKVCRARSHGSIARPPALSS